MFYCVRSDTADSGGSSRVNTAEPIQAAVHAELWLLGLAGKGNRPHTRPMGNFFRKEKPKRKKPGGPALTNEAECPAAGARWKKKQEDILAFPATTRHLRGGARDARRAERRDVRHNGGCDL